MGGGKAVRDEHAGLSLTAGLPFNPPRPPQAAASRRTPKKSLTRCIAIMTQCVIRVAGGHEHTMKKRTERRVLQKRLARAQVEAERAVSRGYKAALELLPSGPRRVVTE